MYGDNCHHPVEEAGDSSKSRPYSAIPQSCKKKKFRHFFLYLQSPIQLKYALRAGYTRVKNIYFLFFYWLNFLNGVTIENEYFSIFRSPDGLGWVFPERKTKYKRTYEYDTFYSFINVQMLLFVCLSVSVFL